MKTFKKIKKIRSSLKRLQGNPNFLDLTCFNLLIIHASSQSNTVTVILPLISHDLPNILKQLLPP